jgi:C_GCAxxG_C_C family probable redox protein
MKTTEEIAIDLFKGGLNCSQSVITSYAEKLDFDKGLAMGISCGFGGGMGRLQDTCGAVTGAFMVLGIYNCKKYADNKDRKENTYSMVKEFNKKFKAIHATTNCRLLLGSDLNTVEGQKYVKEHNLHEIICEKCIKNAVQIVNELTN